MSYYAGTNDSSIFTHLQVRFNRITWTDLDRLAETPVSFFNPSHRLWMRVTKYISLSKLGTIGNEGKLYDGWFEANTFFSHYQLLASLPLPISLSLTHTRICWLFSNTILHLPFNVFSLSLSLSQMNLVSFWLTIPLDPSVLTIFQSLIL